MRLRDEHGTPVELSKVIGKGGEAEIWAVLTHNASVAKIYHGPPMAEREAKLRAMIAQPPADPTRSRGHVSICWPQTLLFDPTTRQSPGFLMPLMDRSKHRELFKIYNPSTRRSEAPDFTWAYLVTAAENIASVIASIHAKGYVVGDMNESNFFISSEALATIVDCDSMQVTSGSSVFRCTVFKPEYTAPELQGADLSKAIRTQEQDNFALAVLIFHLLMEGFHPYSGIWHKAGEAPLPGERIARGDSPYGRSSRISPSPGAPPIATLPAAVRELFVRAFYQGNRDPAQRPSAKEWQEALHTLGLGLVPCKVNSQHQYANHLSRCPWCERTTLLQGRDPFPSLFAQKAMPNRPFQARPTSQPQSQPQPQPQPAARRPVQAASTAAPPRFQAAVRVSTTNTILSSRTLFRLLLFILPFAAAAIGLLLVSSSSLTALLLLRNTWLLAVGLGVARRLQLRRYGGALYFLAIWLGCFYAGASLLGATSVTAALSRSTAEGLMTFFASRFLLQLMRLRMDHYRLIGHTGRIAAVLALAVAIAPIAALSGDVPSLVGSTLAGSAARALTAAQSAASPQVTLSTCANIVGRCGCTPKIAFHRGETVSLLALSPAMPRLDIQVEPAGQPSTRINFSNWRTTGLKHCAAGQYKVPAGFSPGFAHLHLVVDPGAPSQARAETGFSVLP